MGSGYGGWKQGVREWGGMKKREIKMQGWGSEGVALMQHFIPKPCYLAAHTQAR